MSKNDDEVLVRVEGVSKKFCRSLKKSLWYGVCDIAGELLPGRKRRETRVEGRELSDTSAQDISRSTLDSGRSTAAASALDSSPLAPSTPFPISDTVIRVENLSKLYRLGEVGTGSLAHDVTPF